MKLMRSLHQKKFRNETGLFIVEGKKMVEEAMASGFTLHSVYTTDPLWQPNRSDIVRITSREMESISALSTPAGYIAAVHQLQSDTILTEDKFVFVLDGINDPGNLGTIVRTADWFGVKTVLCTTDTVDIYNPKVVQSTMGSIFHTHVHYLAQDAIAQWCSVHGFALTGADLTGSDIFGFAFPEKTAMVIGSESHGIRPELKTHIRQMVHIPGEGSAESLNAGVAAAIMISSWFKASR